MLDRQEHAYITSRWIERPHDGDHKQRPEARDRGKSEAGQSHHRRGCEQQRPIPEAVRVDADEQRQDAGAQQRARGDDADLERRESQRKQVDRQQQAHKAIAERAQRAHP